MEQKGKKREWYNQRSKGGDRACGDGDGKRETQFLGLKIK